MPSRILLLALAALPATQAFSASLLPHAAPALRGSSVARSVTCSAGGVPGAASPLGRRGALGALAGGFVAGACVLGAPGGASAASFEEFMAAKAKKEKVQSRQASDEEYVAGDVAPTEVVAPSDPSASVSKAAVEDAPPTPAAPVEDAPCTPAAPVDPLKSALVSILRVQEATLQEERLITTGNFKDLQRNNIKMVRALGAIGDVGAIGAIGDVGAIA
ncbi:hypothetical protein T484DRAFT_1771119 [Baffinella frigidus]|nr:hypothetical protein T484DRAFT_1771119 [Cryptophyta sp. CCMP2293]